MNRETIRKLALRATKPILVVLIVCGWVNAVSEHSAIVLHVSWASVAVVAFVALLRATNSRLSAGTWAITTEFIGKHVGGAVALVSFATTVYVGIAGLIDLLTWASNLPSRTYWLRWLALGGAALASTAILVHEVQYFRAFIQSRENLNTRSESRGDHKLAIAVSKELLARTTKALAVMLVVCAWANAMLQHQPLVLKASLVAIAVIGPFTALTAALAGSLAQGWKQTSLFIGMTLGGGIMLALLGMTLYVMIVGSIDIISWVSNRPSLAFWFWRIALTCASLVLLVISAQAIRHYRAFAVDENGKLRSVSEESRKRAFRRLWSTGLVTTLLPWINVLWTHPLGDMIDVAQNVTLVILVVSAVATLVRWWLGRTKPGMLWYAVAFVAVPQFIFILSMQFYVLIVSVLDLFHWVQSPDLSRAAMLFRGAAIALTLGTILFIVRVKCRSVYGLTEIVAGMVIAAERVANQSLATGVADTTFYFAVLTAGIYLVVRGLDNVHQGLTKEPLDPLGQRLLLLLALDDEDNKPRDQAPETRAAVAHADLPALSANHPPSESN